MSNPSTTSILRSHIRLLGIFQCLVLAACSNSTTPSTDEDLFARGEELCLEQRWGEARNVLREFLLDNPDHPGAHFYLGRSYLSWEQDFRPMIAEGELQTALRLFRDNDRVSYIDRFPADYFELICNIESTKVCLKEFTILQSFGATRTQLRSVSKRARIYIDAAKNTNPDSDDVKIFEDLVRQMELHVSRLLTE